MTGLTLKIEKRLSKGLSFLSNYTWAHNIDYMDASRTLGIRERQRQTKPAGTEG